MKQSQTKILTIIPARSGSQRVKNKNIRSLNGIPLIAYTIQAAQDAKLVSRVIISTDSEEIADVANSYGAEVPFLRPRKLATPNSTETEYHQHALDWLSKNEDYRPDIIVNLYPTCPFRSSNSIDSAIKKMLKYQTADSLRSVRKCSEHPFKMWKKKGEFLNPFINTDSAGNHTLSYHLLPSVFIQNACIYITKPNTILKYGNTVGKKIVCYLMDEYESFDINIPLDFQVAESLITMKSKR